jgi:hypothetical protein
MISAEEAKRLTLTQEQVKEEQKKYFLEQIDKHIRMSCSKGMDTYTFIMNKLMFVDIEGELTEAGYTVDTIDPEDESSQQSTVILKW